MKASTVLSRQHQRVAELVTHVSSGPCDLDAKLIEIIDSVTVLLMVQRAVLQSNLVPDRTVAGASVAARIRVVLFAAATTPPDSPLFSRHLRELVELLGERTTALQQALLMAHGDADALDREVTRVAESGISRSGQAARIEAACGAFASEPLAAV